MRKGLFLMPNEFYYVEYDNGYGGLHYFKDKDSAFAFLWQKFLDIRGDSPEEYINEALEELNEFYQIEDFGSIQVCNFED